MASQPKNRHALRKGLIIAGVVAAGAIGWSALKPKPSPPPVASQPKQVTALGRLTPEGSLVPLSIPAGTAGGNEIVERWFAGEGDTITKGQVLVRLSSYDELQSALVQAESKLKSTGALLPFLKVSQNRGKELFQDAPSPRKNWQKQPPASLNDKRTSQPRKPLSSKHAVNWHRLRFALLSMDDSSGSTAGPA